MHSDADTCMGAFAHVKGKESDKVLEMSQWGDNGESLFHKNCFKHKV